MRRARTAAIIVALGAAGAFCSGCSFGRPAPTHITVLEPLPVSGAVVTLGAGDALGRAVFIQDIILAAAESRDRAPVVVDAPVFFDLEDEPR